jgi:hypothetical protein
MKIRKERKTTDWPGFEPKTCGLVGARRYRYTTCEQAEKIPFYPYSQLFILNRVWSQSKIIEK